jgi:hypothetical protein
MHELFKARPETPRLVSPRLTALADDAAAAGARAGEGGGAASPATSVSSSSSLSELRSPLARSSQTGFRTPPSDQWRVAANYFENASRRIGVYGNPLNRPAATAVGGTGGLPGGTSGGPGSGPWGQGATWGGAFPSGGGGGGFTGVGGEGGVRVSQGQGQESASGSGSGRASASSSASRSGVPNSGQSNGIATAAAGQASESGSAAPSRTLRFAVDDVPVGPEGQGATSGLGDAVALPAGQAGGIAVVAQIQHLLATTPNVDPYEFLLAVRGPSHVLRCQWWAV